MPDSNDLRDRHYASLKAKKEKEAAQKAADAEKIRVQNQSTNTMNWDTWHEQLEKQRAESKPELSPEAAADLARLVFHGEAFQILDTGILARGIVMTKAEWKELNIDLAQAEASRIQSASALKTGSDPGDGTINSLATLQVWQDTLEKKTRVYMIEGTPSTLVDGDKWKGTVSESGTFQYTSAAGGRATVRKYIAQK